MIYKFLLLQGDEKNNGDEPLRSSPLRKIKNNGNYL